LICGFGLFWKEGERIRKRKWRLSEILKFGERRKMGGKRSGKGTIIIKKIGGNYRLFLILGFPTPGFLFNFLFEK